MTKNKIKKIGTLALVGLVSLGAYAWLNSSEIQAGTNYIKPGQISIMFDNESDAIALTAANGAIPMTHDYAKANLTSYKFDIVNDGDVALNYVIYANNTTGSFDPKNIDIMLKDGERDFYPVGTLDQINKGAERGIPLVGKKNVPANETHSYQLIAHIKQDVELAEYDGKDISFGLRVEAEQYVTPTSPETTLIVFCDSTAENIKSNPYTKTVQFMFNDETGTLDTSKYSVEGLPEGFTYEAGEYSLNIKYTVATQTTLTNIKILYDGAEVEIHDANGVLISQPLTIDIVSN